MQQQLLIIECSEDMDTYSSFLTEVTKYHEVIGTGSRDEGNKQKTSDYDLKM